MPRMPTLIGGEAASAVAGSSAKPDFCKAMPDKTTQEQIVRLTTRQALIMENTRGETATYIHKSTRLDATNSNPASPPCRQGKSQVYRYRKTYSSPPSIC